MVLPENGNQLCYLFFFFFLAVIPEGFSLDVCLITLTCITSFKSLGPDPESTRVFSSDSNPTLTKERKAGWHQFSLGNKMRHGRALHDFFLGTLGKGDWTPGRLIPPTPTWAPQAILSPVKWKQAFPGCGWQEKCCDTGSQVRVQVRSFWAVSGLTLVQWILAHGKRASTSAFSLPYPILFEQ